MTRGTSRELGSVAKVAGQAGDRAGSDFTSGFKSRIAGRMAGIITAGFALAKVSDVAKFGLEVASQNEQAQISFTTLLKSGAKAKAFIGDLQRFAAKTPFDFPGLQQSASQLLAAGIDSKKIIPIMTTLGNVTSGMGTGAEGVQRATVAIQQMNAAQKISAEDLNQLRDAGIPVYDLLSKALGKSKKQVAALVQAGKLGKPALDKMMSALTSGKGLERFNGLMAKQSKSLQGMWSTVKDTFGQGLAKAIAPSLPLIKSGLGKVSKFMGPALGTLGKAVSKGLSGVFGKGGLVDDIRNLWQSVQPYFAQLGANIETIFGPSLSSAQSSLGKLKPSFDQVEQATVGVVSGLTKFSGWIAKNKGLIEAGATTIGVLAGGLKLVAIQQKATAAGGFVKWITGVVKSTRLWAAAEAALDVVMEANPIGLVVVAVAALVAGFVVAYKKSATFRKIVQGALNGVKAAAQAVAHWFTGSFVPFFTKTIPNAFRSGLGKAKKIWSGITSAVTAPMKAGMRGVTSAWHGITGSFTKSKNWVGSTWRKGWSAVSGWVGNAVGKGRDLAKSALKSTQDRFAALRSWGGSTFKRGWSNMSYNLSHPIEFGRTLIQQSRSKIQSALGTMDSWGRSIFGRRWAGMKAKLTQPITAARDYLKRVFGKGGGGIRQIFSDAVSAIGKIFGRIRGALLAPIKSAIGVINTGLIRGGINWILGKLGVPKDKQVPWIPTPKFAAGDRVRGANGWQRSGTDRIPAWLDHDEFVIKRRSARAIGYDKLRYMNDTGMIPGLAGGGRVWPTNTRNLSPTYPGHSGVDIAAGMGAPIYATEPGRISYTGWNHGFGQAIFEQFSNGLQAVYGHTSRLLTSAGQQVAAGQRIGLVGATGHATGPHLHFEINSPGPFGNAADRANSLAYLNGANVSGGGGGIFSDVWNFLKGLSPIDWLKKKATAVGHKITAGGRFAAGLSLVPGLIIGRGASSLMSKFFGSGSAGVSGDAQAVIHSMMLQRWPESQWGPLKTLINNESGWRTGVRNASSGAFGLFQLLGANFAALHGDTSIQNQGRVGLGYIASRYGSPANALQQWMSRNPHWYDNGIQGGVLPPGTHLLHNGTGQNETIRTARQEAALASGPQIVINVNGALDPVAVARQIERLLTQYGRMTGPVQLNRRAA